MKTWQPDTCPSPGCIVEEIYVGSAITGMGAVVQKCAAHLGVADAALYGVLYANADGENKRKNLVEGKLQTDLRSVLYDAAVDEGGNLVLKAGINVILTWSGTGSTRVLTITITGVSLTNGQKNSINNYCTATFGAGKVVLVN